MILITIFVLAILVLVVMVLWGPLERHVSRVRDRETSERMQEHNCREMSEEIERFMEMEDDDEH